MSNIQLSAPNTWNVSTLVGPEAAFTANQVNETFDAVVGNAYSVDLSTNNVTASLPDATLFPGALVSLVVAASPSYTLTVESSVAAQTVGGSSTVTLNAANDALLLMSDGENYAILSSGEGNGLFLPLSGGEMSGQIQMNGNDIHMGVPDSDGGAASIHNLNDPVYPHSAANKEYVDNSISDLSLGAAAVENLGADVVDDGSGNLTLTTFEAVAGTYSTISSITINAEGRITAITAS